MTRRYYLLLCCLAFILPTVVLAAAPTPVGYWLVQEGTSVVQIDEAGGKLGGRIVWLKEPNYPSGSDQGPAGQPKVDAHNPDAAKRDRKLLGLPIVWGLSPPDAKGVCDGGQVYDPRNGKTYSGTITMAGQDRLELRGYILVSLIGRSSTWTRVDPGKYGLKP